MPYRGSPEDRKSIHDKGTEWFLKIFHIHLYIYVFLYGDRYYKMLVDFEIRGSMENYIEFRNIIASEKNIVNIESEEILRDKLNIIAKATVSLVKTP